MQSVAGSIPHELEGQVPHAEIATGGAVSAVGGGVGGGVTIGCFIMLMTNDIKPKNVHIDVIQSLNKFTEKNTYDQIKRNYLCGCRGSGNTWSGRVSRWRCWRSCARTCDSIGPITSKNTSIINCPRSTCNLVSVRSSIGAIVKSRTICSPDHAPGSTG